MKQTYSRNVSYDDESAFLGQIKITGFNKEHWNTKKKKTGYKTDSLIIIKTNADYPSLADHSLLIIKINADYPSLADHS